LQRAIRIADESEPSEARRVALGLADRLHFNDTRRGEAAIVVTEAARNVLLHGHGGEIVLTAWTNGDAGALDILALDKGPGMKDLSQCLRDGYSTTGTPGTGLGAISRIASLFEVQSFEQAGTALFARLQEKPTQFHAHFVTGAVCLPFPGEPECGDAWAARHRPGRSIFILADGLGHGAGAAEAATEALRIFEERSDETPHQILARIHDALRKTRGAAVAICEIDTIARSARFAGVGNIAAAIIADSRTRSMVSHNGIVGHSAVRFQEFSYPWPEKAILVMHSDGISSHWDLERYPGLQLKHPQLIAGVIYRDARRGRDDATVLIAREVQPA